jgi:hypothetical protein
MDKIPWFGVKMPWFGVKIPWFGVKIPWFGVKIPWFGEVKERMNQQAFLSLGRYDASRYFKLSFFVDSPTAPHFFFCGRLREASNHFAVWIGPRRA